MTQTASNHAALPARVRPLIAQIIGISCDRVVGSAALAAELGATSLDSVEIVMAIEDEFEIEISDGLAAAVVTVDDLERLILRLLTSRKAPMPPKRGASVWNTAAIVDERTKRGR